MNRLLIASLATFVFTFGGSTFAASTPGTSESLTQSNVDPRIGWPKPVDDSETFGLILFDLLEYRPVNDGSLTWDMAAWRGGDINRLWVKSEGNYGLASSSEGEADFQLLYGRLVTAFFDAQVGARLEQAWGGNRRASRPSAALGLQGISLYVFELEAAIFLGEAGYVAGRATASKDFLFTQKAIAQLRIETNAAAKRSDEFAEGAGVNDLSLGLRLRYEIKREVAPYIGINWANLFGETADIRKQRGADASEWTAVVGLRLWY